MNNTSDVYAEIEKRKQRAIDLHLREEIYWLFFSDLKYWPEKLGRDPELKLPSITEFTFSKPNAFSFKFGGRKYELICTQRESEVEHTGHGRRQEETTTTHGQLTFCVDDVCSFRFQFTKMVRYTREMPIFDQTMGQVTAFIEGAWVTDILGLRSQIKAHEQQFWARRRAPQVEEKLKKDMKAFGL